MNNLRNNTPVFSPSNSLLGEPGETIEIMKRSNFEIITKAPFRGLGVKMRMGAEMINEQEEMPNQ